MFIEQSARIEHARHTCVEDKTRPDLCIACKEAGCDICTCEDFETCCRGRAHHACQAEGAYEESEEAC